MQNQGKEQPVYITRKNADGIQTRTVIIAAVNTPIKLPAMKVPDGFEVLILSWPAPFNIGTIFVAESKEYARDMNYVTPLRPGQALNYGTRDPSRIWITGTAPGDTVTVTVEKNDKE